MPNPIDKTTLEHLARLARIELQPGEEEKFIQDLRKILDYFAELQELNTAEVSPGEDGLKNAFREDDSRRGTREGRGAKSFPESQRGFLKVPPVFSAENGE